MFDGKIHTERNTAAAKEFRYEIKNVLYDDGWDNRDEGTTNSPHGCILGKANQCYKTNLNLPHGRLSNSGSSGSGEHWIKTDADCKYISKFQFRFTDMQIAHSSNPNIFKPK